VSPRSIQPSATFIAPDREAHLATIPRDAM